jgi:hypothetical protein
MTRKHIVAVIFALVMAMMTAGAALAWPVEPFSEVEVSGPGIEGVAVVTGDSLGGMTIENFTDFSNTVEAPAQLGAAYALHRYFWDETGQLWDFDRVIYTFDPAGGPGYVFYEEGVGFEPSHNEGKWFRATPQAAEIMRGILTPLGAWPAAVAATGGVFAPVEVAAAQPAIAQPATNAAIVMTLAALLGLALFLSRKPVRNLAVGLAHRKLR